MEIVVNFIDFFIHLDRYLNLLISSFGFWTYVLLFPVLSMMPGLFEWVRRRTQAVSRGAAEVASEERALKGK